jgi:hypothetical protein
MWNILVKDLIINQIFIFKIWINVEIVAINNLKQLQI